MKFRLAVWGLVLALLSFQDSYAYRMTASGGHDGLLSQLGVAGNEEAMEKLEGVLALLARKQPQYKRPQDFVAYLYYYTHRKLLKKYSAYPSLSETLAQGSYDCLTATTIYAILLTELNIPHVVVETNYHIYLLVYPGSENEILLEPTDPRYGFVTDRQQIARQKQTYRQANSELQAGQVDLHLNIERQLTGRELRGLLYYNQSVRALNGGNYQRAAALAEEAGKYYTDSRVTKLLDYIASI